MEYSGGGRLCTAETQQGRESQQPPLSRLALNVDCRAVFDFTSPLSACRRRRTTAADADQRPSPPSDTAPGDLHVTALQRALLNPVHPSPLFPPLQRLTSAPSVRPVVLSSTCTPPGHSHWPPSPLPPDRSVPSCHLRSSPSHLFLPWLLCPSVATARLPACPLPASFLWSPPTRPPHLAALNIHHWPK